MDKKTILLILATLTAIAFAIKVLLFPPVKKNPVSPVVNVANQTQILPSQTLKLYTDPSGFAFNYPDNLSLTKNETLDTNIYTDIQLTSKEIEGSLALKISDTKFTTLDEWIKSKKTTPSATAETKLGKLPASQFQLEGKTMLAAIDQGVLFTLEAPNKEYWMEVTKKVAADFSFAPPQQEVGSSASEGVVFEGEEIVE